jgi:hypothetical protein
VDHRLVFKLPAHSRLAASACSAKSDFALEFLLLSSSIRLCLVVQSPSSAGDTTVHLFSPPPSLSPHVKNNLSASVGGVGVHSSTTTASSSSYSAQPLLISDGNRIRIRFASRERKRGEGKKHQQFYSSDASVASKNLLPLQLQYKTGKNSLTILKYPF